MSISLRQRHRRALLLYNHCSSLWLECHAHAPVHPRNASTASIHQLHTRTTPEADRYSLHPPHRCTSASQAQPCSQARSVSAFDCTGGSGFYMPLYSFCTLRSNFLVGGDCMCAPKMTEGRCKTHSTYWTQYLCVSTI
jgi:hypothetical protein